MVFHCLFADTAYDPDKRQGSRCMCQDYSVCLTLGIKTKLEALYLSSLPELGLSKGDQNLRLEL